MNSNGNRFYLMNHAHHALLLYKNLYTLRYNVQCTRLLYIMRSADFRTSRMNQSPSKT